MAFVTLTSDLLKARRECSKQVFRDEWSQKESLLLYKNSTYYRENSNLLAMFELGSHYNQSPLETIGTGFLYGHFNRQKYRYPVPFYVVLSPKPTGWVWEKHAGPPIWPIRSTKSSTRITFSDTKRQTVMSKHDFTYSTWECWELTSRCTDIRNQFVTKMATVGV